MAPKYGPPVSFSAASDCVNYGTTSPRCFSNPLAANIGTHRVFTYRSLDNGKESKAFPHRGGRCHLGRAHHRAQLAGTDGGQLRSGCLHRRDQHGAHQGYTPDSAFRRFVWVDALDTEEISDGLLKGKLGLYAVINPTDELVTMTGNMQKLFTSMEIRPEFADTGEAYLIGLAVTDDPASLGTEMLQFSASAGANPLANANSILTTCLPPPPKP